MKNKTGLSAIRAAFKDAQSEIEDSVAIDDPDPNLPRNDIAAGKWEGFPFSNLPPDCPVQVLGHDVDITYCVSATGQLHAISRWDSQTLPKLFAPFPNYYHWAWPGKSKAIKDKDGEIVQYPKVERAERDKAATCLISEGARMGLFDPQDRVRGRGGWQMGSVEHGTQEFVWHSGEWLWSVEHQPDGSTKLNRAMPGALDGMLYVRKPDTIQPWQEPIGAEDSPAHKLLQTMGTWSWERPHLDPVLVLGWLGGGFYGAGLSWRAHAFTTGGRGVGKSTLQNLVEAVFQKAVYKTANTTAAGIYQRVKQDCLPVMVDEMENKAGNNKADSIIELARIASSGDKGFRGSADGTAGGFTLHNSFMFSAIIPPPMAAQDKSRMAVMNLDKLDRARISAPLPVIKQSDGRMILRQLMDGWDNLTTELLPKLKELLGEAGFDNRDSDTYGTLLAIAQLLVGDKALIELGLPVDDGLALAALIAEATKHDRSDQMDPWEDCIEHILESHIDGYKSGERPMVSQVLLSYSGGGEDVSVARGQLAHLGLGLRAMDDPVAGSYCLAVPTSASSPNLLKLFADTRFERGSWAAALRQGPKDIVLRDQGGKQTVKISGSAKHCYLVDVKAFVKHMDERWVE